MDVVRDLLSDCPDINYGALYENAVAQELACHGFGLAYYKSRSIGELDFVVQTRNRVVLTKALRTENFGIERAIVLHEGNVERDGKILYLPAYMAMCLEPGF